MNVTRNEVQASDEALEDLRKKLTSGSTEETSPIDLALTRLHDSIRKLGFTVTKLVERLEPALCEHTTEDTPSFGEDEEPYDPSSALVKRIKALDEQVRDVNYDVNTIHDRLEV